MFPLNSEMNNQWERKKRKKMNVKFKHKNHNYF